MPNTHRYGGGAGHDCGFRAGACVLGHGAGYRIGAGVGGVAEEAAEDGVRFGQNASQTVLIRRCVKCQRLGISKVQLFHNSLEHFLE